MKQQHETQVANLLTSVAVDLTEKQAIDFSRQIDDKSVDFAIIVALQKELTAVKHYFPELAHIAPSSSSTRSYYSATIPTDQGGSYRVVVTLLHSMGNLEAAHATSDLIREWNPRFVLVNGIAGGISGGGRELGDVVVSSSVVYYELAKIRSNEQERRSRHFQADPSLLDGVLNLTSSDWKTRLPPIPDATPADRTRPRMHIGPIASGEKVVAAIDAVHRLRAFQKDLIAIEMESAGVASAAFSAVKKVGFLAIRAICDFADGAKNDCWQEYAAYSAASFLRSYIESRPVPLSEGEWPRVVAPAVPRVVAPAKMPNSRTSVAERKRLFDQLCSAFDMEEFKNLCFLLGVDVDELSGDRKSARVRELILLFERRSSLEVLEEAVFENAAQGKS